jgi:hypothetical protein
MLHTRTTSYPNNAAPSGTLSAGNKLSGKENGENQVQRYVPPNKRLSEGKSSTVKKQRQKPQAEVHKWGTDHILEIVGFPFEVLTEHILAFLGEFQQVLHKLKWVNEKAVLAIFTSAEAANAVLRCLSCDIFTFRPFNEAHEESKKLYESLPKEAVEPTAWKTLPLELQHRHVTFRSGLFYGYPATHLALAVRQTGCFNITTIAHTGSSAVLTGTFGYKASDPSKPREDDRLFVGTTNASTLVVSLGNPLDSSNQAIVALPMPIRKHGISFCTDLAMRTLSITVPLDELHAAGEAKTYESALTWGKIARELRCEFTVQDAQIDSLERDAALKIEQERIAATGQLFVPKPSEPELFKLLQLDDFPIYVKSLQRKIAGDAALLKLRDANGWSPLHWAVYGAKINMSEALLQAGANVNALDLRLQTPLHIAVVVCNSLLKQGALPKERLAVIELLLKRGAQQTANASGQTPILLASPQLAQLLPK